MLELALTAQVTGFLDEGAGLVDVGTGGLGVAFLGVTFLWQQLTNEWWEKARPLYDLVTSELVLAEAARGNREAAKRRLDILEGIPELVIDKETESLAQKLLEEGGIAVAAKADALHVAVAAVHEVDYLLTWNCRHIDNATMKPRMRAICASAGYLCAEICTPLELLAEEIDDVP